jgi:hypothetical protein
MNFRLRRKKSKLWECKVIRDAEVAKVAVREAIWEVAVARAAVWDVVVAREWDPAAIAFAPVAGQLFPTNAGCRAIK